MFRFRKNIYKNSGFKGKVLKKHLQTMGLKVRKQNKIIHFSFIKVIKMYNDNFI